MPHESGRDRQPPGCSSDTTLLFSRVARNTSARKPKHLVPGRVRRENAHPTETFCILADRAGMDSTVARCKHPARQRGRKPISFQQVRRLYLELTAAANTCCSRLQ